MCSIAFLYHTNICFRPELNFTFHINGSKIPFQGLSDGFDDFKLDHKIIPHTITDISRDYSLPPIIMEVIHYERHVSMSELAKNTRVPGFWIEWYYNQDASIFIDKKVS